MKEKVDRIWEYIAPLVIGYLFIAVNLLVVIPIVSVNIRRLLAFITLLVAIIIFLKLILLKFSELKLGRKSTEIPAEIKETNGP